MELKPGREHRFRFWFVLDQQPVGGHARDHGRGDDSGGLVGSDAITVTLNATFTDPIFADGFESGDTSSWSDTQP